MNYQIPTFGSMEANYMWREGIAQNITNRKKALKSNLSIFSFFTLFKRLPLGSDIHYTGTVTKTNHRFLEIDEDYSLLYEKNIFCIDGAVLKGNPIFPGIYIVNNAISFAERYAAKVLSD